MESLKKLMHLFVAFLKVGLFTIGGGYAMLPIIEQELVKSKNMLSMEEVVENYTLAQTLPGVIASNAAALIGYKLGRLKGAIAAVLGVITPSIIIIIFIAAIFKKIEHLEIVQSAFKGIRIAVLALLIDSLTRLVKVAIFDKKTLAITLISFVLVLFSFVNPIFVIFGGALLGSFIYRERVNS